MNRLGLIGNPENRRIVDFQRACTELGYEPPRCLSYEELLAEPSALEQFEVDRIRIDSPGENEAVTQALIALGGGPQEAQLEFGEIGYLSEYHHGFCRLMERISEQGFHCLNAPPEIVTMFDKWACHQRFEQRGVARPPAELAPGSYAEFKEKQLRKRNGRLFLKPLHGSSASGICALRWNRDKMIMQAPLRFVGETLINSLKVRRYEQEQEIAEILDRLLPQGMIAEHWIPKLSLKGGVLDLRVLVIAGAARHRVVRQSRYPMTNLHLGNRRGDLEQLERYLGPERWQAALTVAEQAAACFPESYSVGVDVLLDTSGRAWVCEVNAFGDLLPGLIHQEESAYTAIARELCA